MADGQVIFEIKGDSSDINKTVKQVTNNIEHESKKWDEAVDDSMGKAGKSFLNWKTVAAGAITAIGAAVIKFGQEAVDVASNLSEVQNVVDTVFGEGANQIETWAKKAGQQFGLTELQAKKFTSTLGAMMKSSGLAGKEIINMSTDLAGLAADMASFYNLDFETAFEKIRSGISGQTMPLKQLGIDMSVANLEAFALAQGLEKTFSQMDQGEQTMLRYQYLMKATADAQGDFEKTSDGFANAQRRIESSIESIKSSVGQVLLPAVELAVGSIASFLSQIAADMMPEKTVIDEFNEAKIEADEKLAKIQKTYDSAEDLIKILKEIEQETVTLKDGTTVSITSLFGDLSEIEKNGGNIQDYIAGLGLDVEHVVLEYNKWKEATRQLTSLVPSLSSVIDSETNSINGGTDALQKNLDEWKKNEENKVYWAEYFAKAEAVARAKGEQAGIQITAKARQLAAEREKKRMEDYIAQADSAGINYAMDQTYLDIVDEYTRLQGLADKANKEAEKSANDLADTEKLLADELTATEQITGQTLESVNQLKKEEEDAGDAASYLGKSSEEWVKALEKAPKAAEAIQAVIDYYKGVRDATEQAVNSTVKGFDKIITAYDELTKQSADLANQQTDAISNYTDVWAKWGSDDESLRKMKQYQDETGKLTDRELEAYEALVKVRNAQKETNEAMNQYKPEGVKAALESQIKFMDDYLKNLETLKSWGVSDEMIAQLSDGSAESAAYLAGIVSGSQEDALKISELYDTIGEKKKGFTDALTENKLTVDQTYSDMVETAKEAMEQLDLGEEAANAMGNTVTGIAQGIQSHVGEVSSAVTDLLNALNPLSALGFTWGFSDGSFLFELPGVPHYASGTDFVPSDNFPAFLDYGEAVLTAEENRIWQRFKNGQQPSSMDYDALGGVMRDNVKAGGDVYLDGRTVGHVISDAQGKSYRALQRSGWQG